MQFVTNTAEFNAMLSNLYSAEVFSFDIEGTGLDPYTSRLLLLSFATESESYVIDVQHLPPSWKSALSHVLSQSSAVKVIHNAVFDMAFIYHAFGIEISNVHCTLITDQLLRAGYSADQGFSLADLARRRLGLEMNKAVRDQFINSEEREFTEEELVYSAKDAEVLIPIYFQQKHELALAELERVYQLEMELLPITMKMTYVGVEVDLPKMEAAIPVVQSVIDKADATLQRLFLQAGVADTILVHDKGFRVANLSSVKQVLELVQRTGIDVQSLSSKELSDWDSKWAGKHEPSGVEIEQDSSDFHIGYAHPTLRWHAIYTAANKLMGTYLVGMMKEINPVTRRIHPGFRQCGAVSTGRYSSNKPKRDWAFSR